MTKIQNFLIPYQKYYIDSGKFFIDSDKFTSVKIPQNFTLIDSDTGESLNDFKRNSLEILYGNHKIYVATVKRQLKQMSINKVLIYFASKISGSEYFKGIQKNHILEVLEFLKQKGYLLFDNVNDIYKNIFVKDLDIKCDYRLSEIDRPEIKKYNEILKGRFNGSVDNFHLFDSQKQGFGLSTYKREQGTLAKPFLKFYDKTRELLEKNKEFFLSLPDTLQKEIQNNFIYRFEYTLKDKSFFSKFGITNRLEDIHEVLQEKWIEIGRSLLDINFQIKMRKPKDTSKLNLKDRLLCLSFLDDIEKGLSLTQIKNKYIIVAKTKNEKWKMSILFDKIYFNTSLEHNRETQDNYYIIEKWDNFFGFN